jgi:transcription initiation factor TFIID subunit 15
MVSTIIISPQHNQNIPNTDTTFNVVLSVNNLQTGQFTNPNLTYYSAPQQVDPDSGVILGHTHITIQVSVLILC